MIHEALRLGDTRFYGTLVAFRVGPMLAMIGITRADPKSDTR